MASRKPSSSAASRDTAVTSDHRNVLDERAWPVPIRVYGHRLGILIPALTDIPWLTHTSGERKTVRTDPPETDHHEVDEATNEESRMLGYAE